MRRYSRRMKKPRRRSKRRSQKGGSSTPTFHVLICTGGKPLLKGMIDSLKAELLEGDAITIIFDGPDALKKSTFTDEWTSGFKCAIKKIEENPALGFWGHGARNKYQGQLTPRTTFIMNADDDDTYIAGSFAKLREKCVDPNTLYIAKMTYVNDRNTIIPRQNKEIVYADISTQNGIIPFDMAAKGEWKPKYGGDFDYYTDLKKLNPPIAFLEEVIYLKGGSTSPQNGGQKSSLVTVYILCFNEENIIDFVIGSYRKLFPACKIIIYDNESTDSSVQKAKDLGCEVRIFSTGNKLNEMKLTELRNSVWKDADTPWVIMCDMDEIITANENDLKEEMEKGTTILSIKGYDIIGSSNEENLSNIKNSMNKLTNSSPSEGETKNICFRRDKIEDMNYALGAHTNRPVAKSGAEIKHSEKVYSLYHYKNLGEKYYKYTHHRAKPRVANMEKLGISVHYTTNNNKLSRGEQKVIKTEHQVRPLSSFFIAK